MCFVLTVTLLTYSRFILVYILATMATKDANSKSYTELNAILSEMQNVNKAKRRKALERFQQLTFESDKILDKDYLTEILGFSLTLLITRMSDESEVNRMNASNIVLRFIQESVVREEHMIDIIPIVHHRLATVPVIEESEDVRLLLINIIHALTVNFEEKLITYMNDVVDILKASVIDCSPEVRKAASECVSTYAKASKAKFHMQSGSLVKPLLKGLGHQRFKNRIACLYALGDLLLYGDSKIIQDVSVPLAQCAMDLPQVRLALVGVGGDLALYMPDRYSYWHRILPLLLFGLRDDDADVQQKAKELWSKVGHQYEQENIDQLKEDIDFDVTMEDYPTGEKRPSVGCRILVQRALYHILPGLMTDLDDWLAGPRLQAAKLLTVLVLNADTGITQYAEKILKGLILAADDREANIIKQVLDCSRYLGHFLPPTTYLPLILPWIRAGEKMEHPLIILAALAEGTRSSYLQNVITDIIRTVSSEDVAYVSYYEHQRALLQLIQLIITKCDPNENSFDIFGVLLFIASSSEDDDNVISALDLLDALANKTGCTETSELYHNHLNATLIMLLSSANSWTEHSPQFLMFVGLMEQAAHALGYEMELFVKILLASVPKKQDPFVSLKCLTKLRGLLCQEDHPLESNGQLGQWLPVIVSDCIALFLPWHAGSTAEALRTASVACLEAVCKVFVGKGRIVEELRKSLTVIPALIEDNSEDTRSFTCGVICWIAINYPQLISSETFHILADRLVKRFNDVQQLVRLKAAHVLGVLFDNLPEDYHPAKHLALLQDLFKAAVIFLDDPDDKLQEAILITLEKMGCVCPDLLITTLEEDKDKYRNVHYCQKLIDSMRVLQIASNTEG
ncbi:dynein axonemal assembly factor 5 [Panulirus ornatus]|uniref:dynein axonemal assembly factor 5 n=1 Tax=Panulirus ornatus TaxID=150431 RepID=UPI003A87C14E